MANNGKNAFESLLQDYAALDESANTIVEQLRKTANPDNRRRIIVELQNLENRRVETLDQMHNLGKSI